MSEEREEADEFVIPVPCYFPPWYQNNSSSMSRIYISEDGRKQTVLTAVPTHPARLDKSSSTSPPVWDRNPETFSHPLLRRYSVSD